jgi:myo-inositol-1(or 4)-monophosphatase
MHILLEGDISGIYKSLTDKNAYTHDLGSISYIGVMVAAGEFSAGIHPARHSHDSVAVKIIVEEEGGKVTDFFGNEKRYDMEIKGCIISNGLLHDRLVKIVKSIIPRKNIAHD